MLTEQELSALPGSLVELEQQVAICEAIAKNNNISEIKQFADAVLATCGQDGVSAIREFANKLNAKIDCFDILGIKQSLSQFPILVMELRSLKAQASSGRPTSKLVEAQGTDTSK